MSKKRKPVKHPDGVEKYKTRTGLHWRVWSKGKIVGGGGRQGYSRLIDMHSAMVTTRMFLSLWEAKP